MLEASSTNIRPAQRRDFGAATRLSATLPVPFCQAANQLTCRIIGEVANSHRLVSRAKRSYPFYNCSVDDSIRVIDIHYMLPVLHYNCFPDLPNEQPKQLPLRYLNLKRTISNGSWARQFTRTYLLRALRLAAGRLDAGGGPPPDGGGPAAEALLEGGPDAIGGRETGGGETLAKRAGGPSEGDGAGDTVLARGGGAAGAGGGAALPPTWNVEVSDEG